MECIQAMNNPNIKPGDILLIGNRLELVTDVYDHTFYSAPILEQEKDADEPFRRSSHWVGSLYEEDTVIRFDSIDEAVKYLLEELKSLKMFYEIN